MISGNKKTTYGRMGQILYYLGHSQLGWNEPMSFWDFKRSTNSVRLLTDYGQEQGISIDALLAGSRLTADQLDDPQLELSAAQELAVVHNLVRLLKTSAMSAVQVGIRYHFSSYGIWGYGLISSRTAGEALALALRFLPLTYTFSRISYHEVGKFGILTFGVPDLALELRRFLVERDMAAAATLLRETLGGQPLTQATLCAQPQLGRGRGLVQVWEQLCGVCPEFGAPIDSLVFERQYLSRPLPQADACTVAMCVQMCQQLMGRRRARIGTAALVRQYLSIAPGGTLPALDQVARQLHTSERTLKRRLQEEGTSFREILRVTLRERAVELLRNRQLKLADIAESLGFSDLSSFSQACKRWYGMPPSKLRNTPQPCQTPISSK